MMESTHTHADPMASKEHQKVTWLELFYDLVYVATIIQLGNVLSHHVSLTGFLEFIFLFLFIWWSWIGVTFYANRFLVDDVWHRVLIFAQMFAVSLLAIGVEQAFEEGLSLFALAYAAIRAILVVLFVRVMLHVPQAKQLASHYAYGFVASALIWALSAFVPAPYRYMFWVAGVLVDFGVPLNPATRRLAMQMHPARHHLAERFALITMIVLGESFVKVISSLSGVELTWHTALYGGIGLLIAVSIWWLYFDHIPDASIRKGALSSYTWVYTHMPLLIGMTAVAVAMKKLVLLEVGAELHTEYRWLLCGSIALYMFSIALINTTTTECAAHHYRLGRVQFGAACVTLLLAFTGELLPPLALGGIIAAICVVLVLISWRVRNRQAGQLAHTTT